MARGKRTRYYAIGCIVLTVGAIFALLYQNNYYIAQIYALQELEQKQVRLEAQREALLQRRAQLRSRDAIATYAREELQLQPIRLQSVHSIDDIA